MRANPTLATLSLADLNQRYEQSYVVYKGEPVYVAGFVGTNSKPAIVTNTIARTVPSDSSRDLREPFDWKALDVERPMAGWYPVPTSDGVASVHVSYNIMRQWKRGLCHRNTTLVSLSENVLRGDAFYSILEQGAPCGSAHHTRYSIEEILDTKGTFIPRPQVLITTKNKETSILFATQKVAAIEAKKKRIRLLNNFDPIEVQDVLIAPGWEIVPAIRFEKRVRMHSAVNRRGGLGRIIEERLAEMGVDLPRNPDEEEFVEVEEEDRFRGGDLISNTFYEILGMRGEIFEDQSFMEVHNHSMLFFEDLVRRYHPHLWFGDDHQLLPFPPTPVQHGRSLWTIARCPDHQAIIHSVISFPKSIYDVDGPGVVLNWYRSQYRTPVGRTVDLFNVCNPVNGGLVGIVARDAITSMYTQWAYTLIMFV